MKIFSKPMRLLILPAILFVLVPIVATIPVYSAIVQLNPRAPSWDSSSESGKDFEFNNHISTNDPPDEAAMPAPGA
jgi:hypothetical protein